MKFLFDMFPLIVFAIGFYAFDIYVATGAAMAATALQVAYLKLTGKKVEKMHWITLALLVILGTPTILLHDPTFIKWKPTAVNWLFALAFAFSGLFMRENLIQKMMGENIELPARIWARLNWSWVSFFIFSGAVNIWVAFTFSMDVWVNFKVWGMIGLTLVFVVAQGFYLAKYVEPEQAPAEE